MQYKIEIYEPGSVDDVWISYTSETPFPAVGVGDIINPTVWEGSQSPMRVLRVVAVEHMFWEGEGGLKHKLLVFSEEIEGTRELRKGR